MEKETQKNKPKFWSTIDNRYWIIAGLGLIFLALLFLEIYNATLKPELKLNQSSILVYYPTNKNTALYAMAFIFIAIATPMTIIALIRIIESLRAKYQWTWKTKNNFARVIIYLPSILIAALAIFAIISLFLPLQVSSEYGYNKPTFVIIQTAMAIALFLLILTTLSILPWISKKIFLELESKFYQKTK